MTLFVAEKVCFLFVIESSHPYQNK